MAKNTVMIVDDEPLSLKILTAALKVSGYDVITATNGVQAIEKFKQDQVSVIISDLEMPQMNGLELIQELKKMNYNPLVLVQTAHHDPKTVIDIMKQGVFDYLIKPVDGDYLRLKVDKAFEVAYFRDLKSEVSREYNVRIDNQLTWNAWKESIISRDRDRFDRTLFHNLRTILTQGAGFGGLLSILSLISTQKKNADGFYLVSQDLINILLDNAKMAQKAIDSFNEIDNLLNTEVQLKKCSIAELHDTLSEVIGETMPLLDIKKHRISLSDKKVSYSGQYILANLDLLKQATKELVINAMKFSPEKSSIFILITIMRQKLFISFLSTPLTGTEGIPQAYINSVFEPFFRLSKTLDERYGTLDFGLGLTVVDKIIHIHGGEIRVSNIQSHLTPNSNVEELRVKLEIELPIIE